MLDLSDCVKLFLLVRLMWPVFTVSTCGQSQESWRCCMISHTGSDSLSWEMPRLLLNCLTGQSPHWRWRRWVEGGGQYEATNKNIINKIQHHVGGGGKVGLHKTWFPFATELRDTFHAYYSVTNHCTLLDPIYSQDNFLEIRGDAFIILYLY